MSTWTQTAEVFSRVTDKLGKEIDTGIFETVVALNCLGIATTQSCEGHLDWGVPYPWISLGDDMHQRRQLYDYLARFYAGRPVNFESVLVFHGCRIRSQGAAFSDLFTEEEKRHKLKIYQDEIATFTQFMKSLLTS